MFANLETFYLSTWNFADPRTFDITHVVWHVRVAATHWLF